MSVDCQRTPTHLGIRLYRVRVRRHKIRFKKDTGLEDVSEILEHDTLRICVLGLKFAHSRSVFCTCVLTDLGKALIAF